MGSHRAATGVAESLTFGGFWDGRTGQQRAMDALQLGDGLFETQDLMAQEGRRIVDSARRGGVLLRLLGGFAVHEHCAGMPVCRREHLDIDLAGLRRQTGAVIEVFGDLGYKERLHVRMATGTGQAQFVRECVHVDGDGAPVHAKDSVDVFFDRLKLDHTIDLRSRLDLHPYALPITDTLAMKLQMHAPELRDVRDALTLLAASCARGAGTGDVDADYLGSLCARDWGLFYDVALNLRRLSEALPGSGLDAEQRDKVAGAACAPHRSRRRGAQDAGMAPPGRRRHAPSLVERRRRAGGCGCVRRAGRRWAEGRRRASAGGGGPGRTAARRSAGGPARLGAHGG